MNLDLLEQTVLPSVHILHMDTTASLCVTVILHTCTVIMPTVVCDFPVRNLIDRSYHKPPFQMYICYDTIYMDIHLSEFNFSTV